MPAATPSISKARPSTSPTRTFGVLDRNLSITNGTSNRWLSPVEMDTLSGGRATGYAFSWTVVSAPFKANGMERTMKRIMQKCFIMVLLVLSVIFIWYFREFRRCQSAAYFSESIGVDNTSVLAVQSDGVISFPQDRI